MEKLPGLKVYVIPISGGSFVAQVAFLIEMYIARLIISDDISNIYPDIVLSTSGGNIATYLAMCGGWRENGILRCVELMDKNMLAFNWWPEKLNFMPTGLIGIFTGSLYRPGFGIKKVLNNHLTSKIVKNVEIWTGTFNTNTGRAQFFTNKDEDSTFIKKESFENDRIMYDCDPLAYLNGDINTIADVTLASATIPLLVTNRKVKNLEYTDGGIVYASPLTCMSREILRVVKPDNVKNKLENIKNIDFSLKDLDSLVSKGDSPKKFDVKILKTFKNDRCKNVPIYKKLKNKTGSSNYRLQMIYFSCYDPNTLINITPKSSTITGNVGIYLRKLLNSSCTIDRVKGVEILRALADKDSDIIHKHYRKIECNKLAEIIKMLKTKKHYFLNLYPHGEPRINMINFEPKDLLEAIATVRKSYAAHVWYIE